MNPTGVPVARLFGIEIRIAPAWIVVLAFVTLMSAEQAAVLAPQLAGPLQWVVGGAVAMGFLVSVVAHELAHALTGRRVGVESGQVVLGLIGGLAPMSIEASHPRDELLIALVGPAVSFLVAVAAVTLALVALLAWPDAGAVAGGLLVIALLNAVLGLLNLLPGMPLDGGRAVRAIAWERTGDRDRAGRVTARVGRIAGWATLGIGVSLVAMGPMTEGFVAICFGWLLASGAGALHRRVEVESLMRGVTVRPAVLRDVPGVAPNLTVDTFADRLEGRDGFPALPVVDGGAVLGIIGLRRVRRLGRRKFAATRAADVMQVPPTAPILAPEDDLWLAADLMGRHGLDGLAVAVDGRLEGIVTRTSVDAAVRRLASNPGIDGPPRPAAGTP